jgi:hypothetical protein
MATFILSLQNDRVLAVRSYGNYSEVYRVLNDACRSEPRVSRFVGTESSPAAPRQTLRLYVVAEIANDCHCLEHGHIDSGGASD